ncbi:hypothetical protein CEP52_005994 [Fusarium oligoseptatum]|uniref:Xylanolytic transcriptional activator regulatory domain-containing protein n=1 Tax=Fusarium oligoseptatum TaxID=2604345 RepID=A0A428TV16_9HYPO|nr:hypothetical protein CEP52_005994 [Fusarium oligoseptatum]
MESVLNRKLMAEAADVAALPLLALVAGYRFLSNDEVLAWRVMGQVARLCLELGIHQRTGLLKIQDEEERKNALTSFWSAYVLDRRWAFGTGLPYVVQDEEIDSQLPFPDEYPYLVAMITYSRIGAKVWRQVSHFGPVLARDLRSEELESVDQELLQWYEQIPEEVKVRNWDKEKQITSTPSYNLQRLRIWTYLRLNQMRIWLYTPVLHSATSIMAHPSQSERVVDIAKDTIRYLNHLNNTTNLYRRVQVFYHQFLTSAIAVVFPRLGSRPSQVQRHLQRGVLHGARVGQGPFRQELGIATALANNSFTQGRCTAVWVGFGGRPSVYGSIRDDRACAWPATAATAVSQAVNPRPTITGGNTGLDGPEREQDRGRNVEDV